MRSGLPVALALSAAGAALLLAAGGRTWTRAVSAGVAPLPDTVVAVPGTALVPGLPALALLGLAAVPALLAARRGLRVAVGLLLAAAGTAVLALTAQVLADLPTRVAGTEAWQRARGGRAAGGTGPLDPTAAPWVCLLGGGLLLAAGLVVVARGRRWPALGARFERPAATGPAVEPAEPTAGPAAGDPAAARVTWEALDRGEDPTR